MDSADVRTVEVIEDETRAASKTTWTRYTRFRYRDQELGTIPCGTCESVTTRQDDGVVLSPRLSSKPCIRHTTLVARKRYGRSK